MEAALRDLEENRAIMFDAASYINHLDRVRVVLLTSLLEQGEELNELPPEFFPGQDPLATTTFLSNRDKLDHEQQWRDLAAQTELPFFVRWATRNADTIAALHLSRAKRFDTDYEHLARLVAGVRTKAKAGQDWTDTFIDLHQNVTKLRQEYFGAFVDDQFRSGCLVNLDELAVHLDQPLPLDVISVTVRFEQAALNEPTDVILELRNGSQVDHLQSEEFTIGPAAPAGSGWVGSINLNWQLILDVEQPITADVLSAIGSKSMMLMKYPALLKHGGPYAMGLTEH